MPGRAANMSDGWETKRRRGPGHDWAIIKLARPGRIQTVEVDTAHFKGNFPESCSLEATADPPGPDLTAASVQWANLLPRTKLQAHTRHYFDRELIDNGVVSHLRFNIYPDGGVSRLRVYGTLDD
jgi:allantoicase